MTLHRRLQGAIVLCITIFLFLMLWIATRAVHAATSPLRITEVAADPPDGLEWIRVTHEGIEPTDITQWKFLEDGTKHAIKVVDSTNPLLSPGNSVIVADDAVRLAAILTTTTPIVDSSWGTLREEGEEIGLVDPSGAIVQLFTYTQSGPVHDTSIGSLPELPAESLAPTTSSTWTVRINEVAPNPESGEEWIELFLEDGEYADLTSFRLADAHSTIAQLAQTLTSSSPYGVITLTRAYLNNSGDSVRLIAPDDTEITTLQYEAVPTGGSWAFDTATQTYVVSATPTPGSFNEISQPPTPEKTVSSRTHDTPIPAASPTVDELRMQLSELLPDPSGADDENEFIEVWNPTSSTISLYQWRLRDNRNRWFAFTGTTLEPNARIAIPRSTSALALPNTSGSIALVHPSDAVIDATTYTRTIPGASWSRDAQGFWRYTTSSTPGAPNVIRVPHDPPTAHIELPKKVMAGSTFYLDAMGSLSNEGLALGYTWTISDGTTSTAPMLQHTLDAPGIYRVHLLVTDADGYTDRTVATITVTGPPTFVTSTFSVLTSTPKAATKKSSNKKPRAKTTTVAGTVTAAPGRFGTTMAFIDSHPFLVTLRTKPNTQFASLMIGDRVSLTGTLATQNDIQRLVITSEAHIRKLPVPDLLSPTPSSSSMTPIRDITIKRYGQLLQAQGTITESTKRSTYLDDRTGEILIDLGGVGTPPAGFGPGAVVRIAGIVRSTTGQPVLATRIPQDLEIVHPAPPKSAPPVPPSPWTRWLPPALLATLIAYAYRIYRRRPDVPLATTSTSVSADEVAELISYHPEMRLR